MFLEFRHSVQQTLLAWLTLPNSSSLQVTRGSTWPTEYGHRETSAAWVLEKYSAADPADDPSNTDFENL